MLGKARASLKGTSCTSVWGEARLEKVGGLFPIQWSCQERRGSFAHSWWECKLVQPLWKTAWKFLKELNIELPYHPVIPLLGLYLKELESGCLRDICIFIVALAKI